MGKLDISDLLYPWVVDKPLGDLEKTRCLSIKVSACQNCDCSQNSRKSQRRVRNYHHCQVLFRIIANYWEKSTILGIVSYIDTTTLRMTINYSNEKLTDDDNPDWSFLACDSGARTIKAAVHSCTKSGCLSAYRREELRNWRCTSRTDMV
jgi:hypothetical protein